LAALGRRGAVEYQFRVPVGDMYQIQISGSQDAIDTPVTNFNLALSVDGQFLGHYNLCANASGGSLQCLLPFLVTGTHTLRILWDNAAGGTLLRLKSVKVQTRLGADSDGDGIKDWVEEMVQQQSGLDLTNETIGSYTSPVCLEGRDPCLKFMNLYIEGADDKTVSLTPRPAPNQRWYVNVPLSAYVNADTLLHVSYQNGAQTGLRHLEWLPVNLLTAGNMTIRQGDSLLFNACPTNAPTGKLVITVGTNQLSGRTKQPIAYRFTSSGTYTVTGTYIPQSGASLSGSITVNVVGHAFTSNPDCWTGKERDWDLSSVPSQAVLESDSRLFFEQIATLPDNGRKIALLADENEPRYVLSRLGTGGPVLDSAKANCFHLQSGNNTSTRVVETYSDGSQLVEMLLIMSPVLSDLTVELDVIVGGVTFDDGTTTKILTALDFDNLGRHVVRFIRPASARTSVCHSIKVFQGSDPVGTLR
jgi:hypothetical protein